MQIERGSYSMNEQELTTIVTSTPLEFAISSRSHKKKQRFNGEKTVTALS